MCQKRNSTLVRVVQFDLCGGKKPVRVDNCLKRLIPVIDGLLHNCDLVGCCCGHGRYPMTIVVRYRRDGRIRELLSGTDLPRKKRFYVKDKDGYYYIPEVTK